MRNLFTNPKSFYLVSKKKCSDPSHLCQNIDTHNAWINQIIPTVNQIQQKTAGSKAYVFLHVNYMIFFFNVIYTISISLLISAILFCTTENTFVLILSNENIINSKKKILFCYHSPESGIIYANSLYRTNIVTTNVAQNLHLKCNPISVEAGRTVCWNI